MIKNLLPNKNVLVTGAGRNIGKSIAVEMAGQGANIIFTEINEENLKRLSHELKQYPVLSKGFLSDISEIDDINALMDQLAKDGIKIDILVNNAGVDSDTTTLQKFSKETWSRIFNTNLFGPVYLTKRISGAMIENHVKGSIIFITSIHQWELRRHMDYSASKAAVGMIIKELAVELAPYRIRVNGIAPGYVAENSEKNGIRHKYSLLGGTSIKPEHIGRAAVFLGADYFSEYITGTVIKVDAGLSLFNHLVDQIPPKRGRWEK